MNINTRRRTALAALFCVLLLPFAVILYLLLSEINRLSEFAAKERLGLAYNYPLRVLLEDVLQYRALATASPAPRPSTLAAKQAEIDGDIHAVDTVEAQLGPTLDTAAQWTALKARWARLRPPPSTATLQTPQATRIAADCDALADAVVRLARHAGDTSNLILDPDLDSYYFMDAVVTRLLPAAREIARARGWSQEWAAFHRPTPKGRPPSPQEVTLPHELTASAANIREAQAAVARGLQIALRQNAGLRPALTAYEVTAVDLNEFLGKIDRSLSVPGDGAAAVATTVGERALHAQFRLYDTLSAGLDFLLRARIDGFHHRARLVQLFALIVLVVTIYVFLAYDASMLERNRAEAALQHAEAQYRSIFENATEGIFQTTPDGHYLNANPTLARLYGYDSPAALMAGLQDIGRQLYIEPGRRDEFLRLIDTEHTVKGFESQIRRKDGSVIWIAENVHAVRDAAGRTVRYEGLVTDISGRKRAEQALRESEARKSAVLNAALDAIITIDHEGYVLAFNPAAERIFGYPRAEAVGRELAALIVPPSLRAAHRAGLARYDATGEGPVLGQRIEITALRADGTEFPVELAITRVPGEGPPTFTGFIRDITERQQIERMKTEFISTVSHELRTPLTSIRGSLGLLAGGIVGEMPASAKSLIDIALNNSERLVRLINDILDIEKIESGRMDFHVEPLEIMPLVERALEANDAYGQGLDVRFEIVQALPGARLKGDDDRLMQVLTNLLSNAAKFSPRGDSVQVTVTRRDEAGAADGEAVSEARGKPWIRVAVSDRGPGIPDEFRSHIFQKFAQADSSDARQKGGTGLGLSICKAIVEKSGGHIDFTTQVGVGTTFYFDLPELSTAPAVSAASGPEQARVLICEDDHDVAMLLGLMLRRSGFASDIAYDAEQAQQLLAQNQYAAMTLDLMLPGRDGISLIRDLRADAATHSLPIVVVSAEAAQGRADLNGDAFGVIDWLDKPIDIDHLLAVVREAVRHRRATDPAERPRILHVEDDPDILEVTSAILRDVAECVGAVNLREAKAQLESPHFDLVILDLGLPDGFGLELLPLLKRQSPPIPVVVFSAQEVSQDVAQSIAAALVKSRTSNEELAAVIKALVDDAATPAERA